ncbi:glutamate-rich protein 6B [Lacerta agilis]|uniref:glutamate-rich protein 6B n=1 Tax=Lacerta agilis TaxID=80427 RepID=UPI00141A40B9|nr:glutamate-rich protein 6B [Lacerta agilis]
MSSGQKLSGPGSKDHLESKRTPSLSTSQPADPKPSSSLLTEENVKKLQEKDSASKSALARESIEAYITQSNLFLNKSEASTSRSKEQSLSDEKVSKAGSVVIHVEDACEDVSENIEKSSKKGLTLFFIFVYLPPSKIFPMRLLGNFKESSEDYESDIEDHSETDLCHLGCCEFCAAALKPLPTADYLDEKPEKMEGLICCRTYKEIFQCVVQELTENTTEESTIDITPHQHPSDGSWGENKTKRTLMKEIEDKGGIEQYRDVFEQYIKYGPCIKHGFKLSDHPPKPKKARKKAPEPKEILTLDLEFKAEQLKICHSTKPVKRYYSDGKIFYIFFPDGTGQVYYPSGNVAILISYVKEFQFTYIVLQDNLSYEMQACFANQGFAVCYHRNGKIWLNLDLCLGSYFDRKGVRKKHWNWWDRNSHIHAPPFQPIYLQLNVYIQVKIEAQDQIFLTFTNNHDCLQLNVGAKLKPKDPDMLKFLQTPASSGQLVCSEILLIRRHLASMQNLLKELCLVPPEEIKDFYFLVSDMYDHVHRRQKMRIRSMQR